MGGNGRFRKIRVVNGAMAILEIIQHQPFRCVFIGDMPICLNGGKAPTVLELVLIPQPGSQTPLPNIANIFCQHQSTRFKFCFERHQLRYHDLTGRIPAGKQTWCEVRITFLQAPPPQFDLDNVVEINGIPAVSIFVLFIDTLDALLDRYNTLRTGLSWPTKNQVKKIRAVMGPLSRHAVVPQNLDQAYSVLSMSKQLIAILSGLPPISTGHRLTDCLRRIIGKIETWVETHHASINDDRRLSVTRDVDKGPEPSSAVGEDRDESDDWVEVSSVSAGAIESHRSDSCGERVDDVFDFELLDLD